MGCLTRLTHMIWLTVLAMPMVTRHCTAEVNVTQTEDCWIFQRMPKSGSVTVYQILHAWVVKNKVPELVVNDIMWANMASGEPIPHRLPPVVSGGYSESLRALGKGQGCKWFTMFRHPVSRLVSAYYYCKYKSPGDQGCGRRAINIKKMDIYAFAEFWSNYAMRQYVMGFFTPEEIMASPSVRALESGFPGLHRVGVFINELLANETAQADAMLPSGLHNNAMARFLEPVSERLSKYTAVALLEDFENGLRLFEVALGIPGLRWLQNFEAHGMKNEAKKTKKTEHDETLEWAMSDPGIRKFFWFDILLYDYVVGLYKKQLVEYGLA